MVMTIYSSWAEGEYEKFCSEDWGITEGWEDDCWACYFLCSSFKEDWTFEELMKSLKTDLEESLTESEISEKYLK